MSLTSSNASVGGTNCPDFLYAGVVKKLHKRSKTRFQTRRLQFYNDRVEYYKVEGGSLCGSFPLIGIRVEVRPHNDVDLLAFVYDDIKERQFMFMVGSDVVRATMLWIGNGEQFNNYGATVKKLTTRTVEYMQAGKAHSTVRALIAMKYETAAKHFISTLALMHGGASHDFKDYDDIDAIVDDRPMERIMSGSSCSSDSDGDGCGFSMEKERALNQYKQHSMRRHPPLSATTSFESSAVSSIKSNTIPKHGTMGSKHGSGIPSFPSFEQDEEDGYMDYTQLKGMTHDLFPSTENNIYETASTLPSGKRKSHYNSKQQYSILINNGDDKTVDFGAREVNAIKVKLCEHKDFIEIDISQIGKTLTDLKAVLCSEFDIPSQEDIVCIRKLPDVTIRNDRDVGRIRAGRSLEVEITEE